MDKLLSLTIRSVHKKFQDGSLTPSDLMKMSLKRAEDMSLLNMFVTLLPSAAQRSAEEISKPVKDKKKLFGIPVAIKDNFCTKDVNTTCASKMLENFVPMYDATVVSNLKNSGAIMIGKCNLDQFAMGSGTVDSIYGPTKNVWGSVFDANSTDNDNWRIAGGSSGGCAVAVASGTCMAAIGSDTGGSTRNPAALCGLIGLKPTYGKVSRHGLIPLVNSMDVPGILTRTVDDCIDIYNQLAGPDNMDSTTIKEKFDPIEIQKDLNLKSLRVGIPQEYHCEGMSPEIIEAWSEVVDMLENGGAYVKKVSLPHTSASIAVYSILNQCEVASNMARYDGVEYGLRAENCKSTNQLYATSRVQGFNNVVRNRILAGNYFLLTANYEKYFVKAMKIRRLISDDFDKVFKCEEKQSVDVLLTPTVLGEAPLYEEFIKLDNRDQCALHDYCTQPANMAGIPAISLPVKLSKNKLPLSLQLMGPQCSEPLLFALAKKIENLVNFPGLNLKL